MISIMTAPFYMCFIFIHVVLGLTEKRNLGNDSEELLSQIQDLNRKYEDLLSKYSDMSSKYSEVSTKYSEMTTKYCDISMKYSNICKEYSSMSKKYSEVVTRIDEYDVKFNVTSPKSQASGVFVRWGRKDCPSDNETELVYSGFGGGSWYDHIGAAAEFVCLPRDPNLTTKFTTSNAFMYGAEYDSTDFDHQNGDDLPCVVCRRKTQSSVLMIPGKNSCYSGWTEQYRGYLAAGYYGSKAASQYICLDEHPDVLTAGQRNDNGKLIHPVKAVCGALACPPYHNNMYLTCVVCTK